MPSPPRLAAICLMNCCRGDDGVAKRLASAHGLFPALIARLAVDTAAPETVAAVVGLLRVVCQSGKGRDAVLAAECAQVCASAWVE